MKRILVVIMLLQIVLASHIFAKEVGDKSVSEVDSTAPKQMKKTAISLDELLWGDKFYVITASKKKETINQAPATVIVISRQMIRERGYRDLKDIFNDLPGFDISTNVYGEFSSLLIQRGISGNNKIAILLNGIPITSPSGKQFPLGNNVPIWNLKRIEVVYGPASALYGADAFAVINMITLDASTDGNQIHVNANTGLLNGFYSLYDIYGSLNRTLSQDIHLNVFFRKYASEGQNLKDQYPELSSDYSGLMYGYSDPTDDYNLFVNLQIKDFSITFHRSKYQEQLSKALDPDDHYMYTSDSYWGHNLYQIEGKHNYSFDKLNMETKITYRNFTIDPHMNWVYYSAYMPDKKLKVHQYGVMERYALQNHLDYQFNPKLRVSGGLHFCKTMGIPTGDKTGEPFDVKNDQLHFNNFYNDVYPQAAVQEEEAGHYLQLKYNLLESLTLLAGYRLDNNSSYGQMFTPRLGMVYTIEKNTFKFLGGTAYLAPGFFHRYETWFTTEYGHIQNRDLKPEKLRTIELNWMQDMWDKLKTSTSIYYNLVEDLIVRKGYDKIKVQDSWVKAGAGWIDTDKSGNIFVEHSTNYGDLKSYGLDFNADFLPWDYLKIFFSYSMLGGTNTDPESGEKLDIFKTSEIKFSLGFTLTLLEKLHITPRFRWVSKIATRKENSLYGVDRDGDYIPESPHQRMPGYHLANLHIIYQDLFPGLDFHLNVVNLINEKYYTAGVATEGSKTYLPRVPQNLREITAGLGFRY